MMMKNCHVMSVNMIEDNQNQTDVLVFDRGHFWFHVEGYANYRKDVVNLQSEFVHRDTCWNARLYLSF